VFHSAHAQTLSKGTVGNSKWIDPK
jgi:hypothetical protein